MYIKRFFILFFLLSSFAHNSYTQTNLKKEIITLGNNNISYSIILKDRKLIKDSLVSKSSMHNIPVITDANFSFDVIWTGWHAPHKKNNAENPVRFDKNDFVLKNYKISTLSDRTKQIELNFNPKDNHFIVKMTLQLPQNKFYIRRKIEIKDTVFSKHFLQKISPVDIEFNKKYVSNIVKNGGFGQPVAFLSNKNGVFYGLEYPAADQFLDSLAEQYKIKCSQEIGQIIDSKGIRSNFTVIGISPDKRLKWWFYQYINDIRFPVNKPYTLYNSWYDLRSPEYPGVPEGNVMNEKNIMHIIDLIKNNFVDKYDIHLDAFVLDDGWDIYESDWKMRKTTFPNGMKPISDRLKKMNTGLGIWFGPTGGYSFRKKRIQWMFDHGYEVCGNPEKDIDYSMMCLAGKNYGALFKKRTTDFVKNEGISFFKWDGIQFSCSDSKHGHPVGIYSRRAVMQSVIDKCRAVRNINPNVYLNITSGTWLSPWWLKYANQIWMQGQDYGYASVPSISKRDAAMTYRDLVLYEDFKKNNNWFPISNLMTHGIIKGNLQKLGGESEPLDKFTNNALMYFARGVSMYELYISPDILTDEEWKAISQSLRWAKDRFDILKNSFYIGGDPGKKEAYGYSHFSDDEGIVVVRNPFIKDRHLDIKLDTEQGLFPDAKDLVVEQIYPYHYIYPKTFSAGDRFRLHLTGFETAVYEIYPKKQAEWPLVAGTKFWYKKISDNKLEYEVKCPECANILNKELVENDIFEGMMPSFLPMDVSENDNISVMDNKMNFRYSLRENSKKAVLALLFENNNEKDIPDIKLNIKGKIFKGKEYRGENKWVWKTYNISGAKNIEGEFTFVSCDKIPGNVYLYIIDEEKENTKKFIIEMKIPVKDRIMPPEIYEPGYLKKFHFIGDYFEKQ